MPSERVLVGGGTIYDPTAGSQSSNYYKFSCYDFYKYASTGTRLQNGTLLSPYANDIDRGSIAGYNYNITTNNLFTGILHTKTTTTAIVYTIGAEEVPSHTFILTLTCLLF